MKPYPLTIRETIEIKRFLKKIIIIENNTQRSCQNGCLRAVTDEHRAERNHYYFLLPSIDNPSTVFSKNEALCSNKQIQSLSASVSFNSGCEPNGTLFSRSDVTIAESRLCYRYQGYYHDTQYQNNAIATTTKKVYYPWSQNGT